MNSIYFELKALKREMPSDSIGRFERCIMSKKKRFSRLTPIRILRAKYRCRYISYIYFTHMLSTDYSMFCANSNFPFTVNLYEKSIIYSDTVRHSVCRMSL